MRCQSITERNLGKCWFDPRRRGREFERATLVIRRHSRRKRGGGESGCQARRAQAGRDSLVPADGGKPHGTRRFEPRHEHPAHPYGGRCGT